MSFYVLKILSVVDGSNVENMKFTGVMLSSCKDKMFILQIKKASELFFS